MASQEEVVKIARVIDETLLDDSVRLGLARRIADVLQIKTREFDREVFITNSTKTKRTVLTRY